MSLKSNFKLVQGQLENALEASQVFEDKSIARVLDDILLRQKFWAEDVGLENDPYYSMSEEPSDAIETIKHLRAMYSLLLKIQGGFSRSSKMVVHDLAQQLKIVNDRFCDSEEILDALEELEAGSNVKNRPDTRSYVSEGAPIVGSLSHAPVSPHAMDI